MSSSVASMKKWGIPADQKQKAPEITLLERLVWVKYRSHWWPALLYHSYTELQQHLYDQLDMVLKAQFAMAIMRQVQEKRNIKVARLLGRSILEVIEVEEDCYCEFYWQLPNVLPKACRLSRYNGKQELFLDFHRALDQVEDIIREVSQENFALVPSEDQQTWLERAEHAIANGDDQSTVHFSQRARVTNTSTAPVETDDNASKSSSIATNDVGVWDSMMKTITNSFDFSAGKEENAQVETKTQSVQPDGVVNSSSITSAPSVKKSSSVISKSASVNAQSVASKTPSLKKSPSISSKSQKSVAKSFVGTPSESNGSVAYSGSVASKSGRRSQKTEKADNRSIATKSKSMNKPSPESREPMATETTPFEAHAVSKQGAKNKSNTINPPATSRELAKREPIQILPGLEGDDILPGLSKNIEDAQSIWTGVLNTMMSSRGGDMEEQREKAETAKPTKSRKETNVRDPPAKVIKTKQKQPELRESSVRKEFVRALAAEGTPKEEAEMAIQSAKNEITLWQRLTCMSDV